MLWRRSTVITASTNPVPSSAISGKSAIGISRPRTIPCRPENCRRTDRTPALLSASIAWSFAIAPPLAIGPAHGGEHALDLLRRVAGLGQDLPGVLAEQRGWSVCGRARAIEADR